MELEKKLGHSLPVRAEGEEVTIEYPKAFSHHYLRPVIVPEIGPLAEWVPHGPFDITPYATEKFPDLNTKKSARVVTILAIVEFAGTAGVFVEDVVDIFEGLLEHFCVFPPVVEK